MSTPSIEFKEFPKLARLSRECLITEKIDGTNGQIFIGEDRREMMVGSRSRWLTKETDNFGFHRWAVEHYDDLLGLGPGRHFGEWWGSGIQRGYDLPKGEKRFSLFNTLRWMDTHALDRHKMCLPKQEWAPACCHVVPVIWTSITFNTAHVESALGVLREKGSVAAPGFMKPEGVVIYHIAGNVGFKKTLEKDEQPKSKL